MVSFLRMTVAVFLGKQQMSTLKIFTIGDIVGPAAVAAISKSLFGLRNELGADLVIANGENAAQGNGLDVASAKELLFCGIDVITSGNHIWQKKDLRAFLDESEQIVRPANYPSTAPGSGYTVYRALGYRFLVINVQGVVYMDALDCPFATVDRILSRETGRYDFAIVDFHAEATSEKRAMGFHLDGRTGIVVGTHTHVPTADLCILPGGTGYITDLGMTGPDHSVLGVKKEIIIEKMMSKLPARFELADTPITLSGALFTLDTDTGKVKEVRQIIRAIG